jgi:hypothetical protein
MLVTGREGHTERGRENKNLNRVDIATKQK